MFLDTNDPTNAYLQIRAYQIGKAVIQVDKAGRLFYRTASGINRTETVDNVLREILEAATHGSGDLPVAPPPDTTRVEPPSNLIDSRNVNATLHHREQAQYGRDPAALEYEQANPPADLGAGGLDLTGHGSR